MNSIKFFALMFRKKPTSKKVKIFRKNAWIFYISLNFPDKHFRKITHRLKNFTRDRCLGIEINYHVFSKIVESPVKLKMFMEMEEPLFPKVFSEPDNLEIFRTAANRIKYGPNPGNAAAIFDTLEINPFSIRFLIFWKNGCQSTNGRKQLLEKK